VPRLGLDRALAHVTEPGVGLHAYAELWACHRASNFRIFPCSYFLCQYLHGIIVLPPEFGI